MALARCELNLTLTNKAVIIRLCEVSAAMRMPPGQMVESILDQFFWLETKGRERQENEPALDELRKEING